MKVKAMKVLWIFTLAVIFLPGCTAIKTQSEKMRILLLARDATARAEACRAPIQANPKYARIYEKFGVGFKREPTPEQLADEEVIIDSDIPLGLDWYGDYQYCITMGVQDMGKIDPEFAIIGAKGMKRQVQLINDIISSHPTYGSINRRIADLQASIKAEVRKWAAGLDVRLQAMEEKELAEAREQFLSDVGHVAKTVAILTLATVAALAQAQLEVANAQALYAASHPTYVIVNPIRTTNCNWTTHYLTCQSF